MKRVTAIILTFLTLAAAFSACGKRGKTEAPEGWITVTPEEDESIAAYIDEVHESLWYGTDTSEETT